MKEDVLSDTKPKAPLAGIRVLDFSHVLAGPVCTRLLADLGAEVLRVETRKRADTPWRSTSDPELGRTHAYIMTHRGKKSIAIDLKSEAGGDLARRLAGAADVVVENFSAGVMKRLGLDYERLNAINPRLIFLSMSGYGHDGPRKDWTSMNSNLQAYSGLMMVTEREGQPPVAISNSWMDYVGGLHGAFSVLQALAERRVDGRGRNLDLAQFEAGVGTLGAPLLAAVVDGTPAPRLGNRSPDAAPQGCYPCAGEDAWCVISIADDAAWAALGGALGDPEWSRDPRFSTLAGRQQHHDEIDGHLAAWTAALPAAEAERRLTAAGVAAARVRSAAEVLDDEEAGSVYRLEPGRDAPLLLTGLPFAFMPRRPQSFGKAPRLGEQADETLHSWLGMSEQDIAALHGDGVLA